MNASKEVSATGGARGGRSIVSPMWMLAVTAFAIFSAEAVIMTALRFLPEFHWALEGFIDAFLLVCLVFPALYLFLFRPLVTYIKNHEVMEREIMRLANIPEDDPDPIIEINMEAGLIRYMNGAAREIFPDIAAGGPIDWNHPILNGVRNIANELRLDRADTPLDVMEAEIGEPLSDMYKIYGRKLRYIPESGILRLYTMDITRQEELAQATRRLLAEVKSVKEELEAEHREAEEIGHSLLRKSPSDERISASVAVEPCSEAGGDRAGFFDGPPPGSNGAVEWLALFDASGHGKGAAKFQEVALGGLLSLLKIGLALDKALKETNSVLDRLGTGRFLVGNIFRVIKKGEAPEREGWLWIEEFNIAQLPLLALDPEEEEARELGPHVSGGGGGVPPLGLFEDGMESLAPRRWRVRKGTRIIACTDGVVEALNAENAPFGLTRLKAAAVMSRYLPPEQAREEIVEMVKRWTLGASDGDVDEDTLSSLRMGDDLTLAVVDVNGGQA